eukprot:136922_1
MTFNPTNHPSNHPSHYPSSPPTEAPTRVPTQALAVTPTHGEQEENDATDTTAFVERESAIAYQSSVEWVWVVIAIILSVLILCTATVVIVFYRKGKNTEGKAIQNLKAQVASKNDGNMNMMKQISKEDMGNGQLTSSKQVKLSSATDCKRIDSGSTEGNRVVNVGEDRDMDSDEDSDAIYGAGVTQTSAIIHTKGCTSTTKQGA